MTSTAESPVNLPAFLRLPNAEVARLVRAAGTRVCVFPINGTRRWFLLEHPREARENFAEAYFRLAGQKHVELYRLLFDHGIETLLTPVFGPELLQRGTEYHQLIVPAGLMWLAQNPDFLAFYDEYDVRVRVYGDAGRHFENTEFAYVLEVFDELARRTARHTRHRLFLGICANSAAEAVAEIAVAHYRRHQRAPGHQQIVEAYYGEYVPPVNLFIGFEPPAAFDMPLIATGEEDLYFTVSPSPYLEAGGLRAILYDHLFARRGSDRYDGLSAADWRIMGDFYALNRGRALGVGRRHPAGFWHPLPQVELPPGMNNDTM